MRQPVCCILVVILGLIGGVTAAAAHTDPCHQRHSCPSDTGSYVCGDTGACEHCPDNPYGVAGQPRPAATVPP